MKLNYLTRIKELFPETLFLFLAPQKYIYILYFMFCFFSFKHKVGLLK